MGIRHLQTFQQKKVKNGYFPINILKEIHLFRSYGAKPILVIDLMSFLTVHSGNKLEGVFGGRYQVYERMYHELFQRLIHAGAELVFFIDGPRQDVKGDVWLQRQNNKYFSCIEILDRIAEGKTCFEVVNDTKDVPNIHLFLSELEPICKMYGRVFVSYYNECDLEIATYACLHNALAVIADDSDYLVFQGNWRYWSARNINLANLDTFEYSRGALLNSLQLSMEHMKIFGTLGGNDVLSYERVEAFHRKLGQMHQKFHNIARFIRENIPNPQLSEQDVRQLCHHIFNKVTDELVELIQTSLRSYDVFSVQRKYEPDDLIRYAMDCGKTRLYCLLANKTINFTLLFDDLRLPRARSIYDIALPVIRRSIGIVLQHKNDTALVCNVCTKKSHSESYNMYSIIPEYPNDLLPNLLEFYASNQSPYDHFEDIRWKLLLWLIDSPRIDRQLVKEVSPPYLMAILTIVYLYDINELPLHDADLLLVMTHDLITNKVPDQLPYPPHYISRLVKSSFLYLKMFSHIKRGVNAIGFEKIEKRVYFDGVWLHRLDAMDRQDFEKRLQQVSKYRIYTKT